jgi:O-methyltransferase domain
MLPRSDGTWGRIAIIEMLVGELTDPGKQVTVLDLNMLALLPGQERSLEQFDRLLTAAGLGRTSVRNSIGPLSVIEAVAD